MLIQHMHSYSNSSTSYSYNNHQHIYIPSCNSSSIKLFIQNKAIRIDNITLSFQVCTKANSKQKCMNTTQEHEKGTSLLGYYTTRLAGWLTRSGELKVSKHCSLLHNRLPWRTGGEQTLLSVTYSSPWRADFSRWRT